MSWTRTAMGLHAALVAALALTACSFPAPDPQAAALARTLYDQIRHGDDAAVEAEMLPQYRTPLLKAQLAQVRGLIPPGEPRSSRQTGWRVNTNVGQPSTQAFTLQYDYGDRTVTSEVVLSRAAAAGPWQVAGFHVNTELSQPPPAAPPRPSAPPPKPTT